MVVLEKPLSKVYQEIDMVTTPSGKPVAMVHCNNCTNDMNAWVGLLGETAKLFGADVSTGELFTKLYQKSLEGDADCSGVLTYNYMAGEGVTHLDEGRPMVVRKPESQFTLANFLRSQLYATMSTLKLGMDILAEEHVAIDSLTGHGGLFKTPVVGQKYMAAACRAPGHRAWYRQARAGLTAWLCLRPIWCRKRMARRLSSIWKQRFSRMSSARRLLPIPRMPPASTAISAGTAAPSQRKPPQ